MRVGTPRGFRDILPSEAAARERITRTVQDCFASHGYLPIETPMLEDHGVLERGGHVPDSPFRLFDSDGSVLVLRPDITLAVARMVAGRMPTASLPLRLRYSAPVVREEASLPGQPRQFTQLGIELVGAEGTSGDFEMVELLSEVLETLGVPAWTIVCGSVLPLVSLLDSCAPGADFREQALELVHASDFVGLDELIAGSSLSPAAAEALSRIPRIAGGVEAVAELDGLLARAGVPVDQRGTAELRELMDCCGELVSAGQLRIDCSVINSFDYYTGVIVKAYAEGITAALASGGRYDAVLANYGLDDTAACGFMLSLERLQEVLGEQGESGVVAHHVSLAERRLRIAVPKGALFKPTVAALAEAGLDVEELYDLGRRLIVAAGDVEYVIVRAQDAPAFVAYGGADCGICGNDSIFEANVDLLQLVDLGYGRCRFVVAEPTEAAGAAERAYSWRGTVRVASKYPRITRAYYDRIGQQVDVITLHGNIELGPIVGMCDRIVDITETGATLEQNGLAIVDDVMQCSARFFAGPAAYRSDRRIRELASRLAELTNHED